ncbi:DedA family protein [Corallococcus praedator]|uniref:DedA family protein n=1 Tax=Corallococcus praedator TaxID=2316724 RepID=A0ABX9QRF5_9BACT|nr:MULTISPECIES: DedA family protein [Corallococcus]RKH20289.1 DedA family protein [Corallococcus sp. CA047B]RKH34684.1 DedA family protein [Corallococcus sp. CA031C]RKI16657.1 DedA family protein [Corallococcus praedator]
MEELLTNLLLNSQGLLAYGAVFAILVACGLGVPAPEDITLILGGLLAHKGAASLPGMMAVGFLGILVGDSLIYLAGRRLGSRLGRNPDAKGGGFFAKIVTPEKRAKVESLFVKHGQKIVMIARFMPGVRAVTYFTAGSVGMAYWRFILWDGVAALLSAPAFVWLGFHFGGELETLLGKMKEGQVVVLGSLAVLGVGYFLYRRRRNAKLAAEAAARAEMPPVALPPVPESLENSVAQTRAPSSSSFFDVPADKAPSPSEPSTNVLK